MVTMRVPASSANLGPGFDALGLAVNRFLTCRFELAGELRITASGRDAQLIPLDSSNLIWQTALEVAGAPLPPVHLHIENDIPLGKGLGSSAAALTAGVLLADQLLATNWPASQILDIAARLEGHPDNVAACVLGSIVASATDNGIARAVKLDLHPSFDVGLIVPDFVLPTSKARSVLPQQYSREDAVFNVQRSALLVAALVNGVTECFPAALQDRLHQPYRCCLVPGLSEILELRAEGLLGCVLSGAGPSVLVFYCRGFESVCQRVSDIFRTHGHSSELLTAALCRTGYEIS